MVTNMKRNYLILLYFLSCISSICYGVMPSWVSIEDKPVGDIRSFGAVANGAFTLGSGTATGFDCSGAVEAAQASGSVIFIPEGNWVISRPIVLRSGDRLSGANRDLTYIFYTGEGAAVVASSTTATSNRIVGVTVENMTIHSANASASFPIGLSLGRCIWSQFSNLNIYGPRNPTKLNLIGTGIEIKGGGWVSGFNNVSIRYFANAVRTNDAGSDYAGDFVFYGQGDISDVYYGFILQI